MYDPKSFYDKEKKCSCPKRTLIGKIDLATGEIIPTDGRNKDAKSIKKDIAPKVDKDKHIHELEVENRQLRLQIAAFSKELDSFNKQL